MGCRNGRRVVHPCMCGASRVSQEDLLQVACHHSDPLETRVESVRSEHPSRRQPLHAVVDVADVTGPAAVRPQQRVEVAGLPVVPLHRSSVGASATAVRGLGKEQGDEYVRNVRALPMNKLQHFLVVAECACCRSVSFSDVIRSDVEDQHTRCSWDEVQEGQNITDSGVQLANEGRGPVPEGIKVREEMLHV